jgi:hypothetical protein
MKCVLALCLAQVVMCSTSEPEPDTSFTTTLEDEPAPAPALAASTSAATSSAAATSSGSATSSAAATTTAQLARSSAAATTTSNGNVVGDTTTTGAAGTATTSTPPAVVYEHIVEITVELNISGIVKEADLLDQLKQGVGDAAGSGATVVITIEYVSVTSVIGNLPSPINVDELVTAYASMTSMTDLSLILVNNATHSNYGGGRRLAEAIVVVKVLNDANTDVVVESQRIQRENSAQALATELVKLNPSTYENLALTLPPPTTQLSVTSVITGASSAPTASDIQVQVVNKIPGATVTASVVTVTVPPATGTATTTANTNLENDNHTPLAPLITIWAIVYAFVVS